MRLLTFATAAGWRIGLRADGSVLDLLAVHAARPAADWAPVPDEIERRGLDALPALSQLAAQATGVPGARLDPAGLTLGPCVTAPQKIVAIGLNYRGHAAEAKLPVPDSPIVFSKFANALAGQGSVVTIPSTTHKADYEGELAVIIGRRAAAVPVEDALGYVLGYATANDLSARDLQFRTSQWLLGKTLDGFLPLGPDLVTADEVPDPQALRLRTWVNGALRQDSSTADMIFPVAELIAYVSMYMTLVPGDVLITGTPAGVISGMAEPVWLADGDRVEVEVEGLGRLETLLRAKVRGGTR
jgi:2-keto-4-pentenoate hydratase/2-oxohepta-3-ene-1,7-dioic acid hydratase in catechol pathway